MSVWQKIKGFVSSEIIKNSAKLLTASVIAQIIGLLVYPILTRLYSPEDFGLINLFLSIAGVLSLFATAEFQYAILLPKSDEKAISCVHIGGLITLVVVGLLVCTIPFSETISGWFNAPNLAEWYWAIPIFVLLSGMWTLLNYWYTRNKRFGEIGTYQVTQCLTNAAAKCGFGFTGFVNGGLILSAIVSPFIALAMSIATTWKSSIKQLFSCNQSPLSATFKEYSNFPKYSLPRAIINFFSGNIPIFILTPYFGLTEIGFFGMALTLAFYPTTMVSNALGQVLFQKVSNDVQESKSVVPCISTIISNLLIVIIPLSVVLYFILPSITTILLGNEWQETGVILQIILLWVITSFFCNIFSFIPDIFFKQKTSALIEVILLIVRVIALFAGISMGNFIYSIAFYTIGSIIVQLGLLFWYQKIIKDYETQII